MKAKEYLKQIRYLDLTIQNKLEEIQHIKDQLSHITVVLGQENVGGSRRLNKIEDLTIKMISFEDEMSEAMNELINKKKEITTLIDTIDNKTLTRLLHLRYFCYLTWEEIAVNMHMSIRTVYRLHGKALQEIDKLIN